MSVRETILVQKVAGFPETRHPLTREERALHPFVCRWSLTDGGYHYGIRGHRGLLEAALVDLLSSETGWMIYGSRTGPILIRKKMGPKGTFYSEPSTINPRSMEALLIHLLE